ncbi:MAG: hypothetical protein OEZ39_07770 [Gammaproteobacteria bacterium]|nr:hypothetical protein [Gammaproteobacteria bacterium]MDH5651757.1 hypothetical protein [Gammaproteobacteria bacterium]
MNFFRFVMAGFCLLSFNLSAEEVPMELNGFYLWQFQEGVISHLGKPADIRDSEFKVHHVHRLNDSSFMAFEYLKKDFPKNVFAIQITGYPAPMSPFLGVKLGDPIAKVEKQLGKADETQEIPERENVIHYYNNKNYSVQYDKSGKLNSIKLYIKESFMNDVDHDFSSWSTLREAIKAKNVDVALGLLRPDMEIYKNGSILSVKQRYADFLKKTDGEIYAAIFGDKDSVRAALLESEPAGEARIIMGLGVGQVYKFYSGSIVREIVLFPFNGKFRVYEIAFCYQNSCDKLRQNAPKPEEDKKSNSDDS